MREEGCQSCHDAARVCECEDADPPGSAAGLPRVPRQPAACRTPAGSRTGVVPPAFHDLTFAAIPQLHHLPPEDSRQPHGQEPAAMRTPVTSSRSLSADRCAAQQPAAPAPAPTPLHAAPAAELRPPVPSPTETWLDRLHRSRLSLGHRCRRKRRHVSQRSWISAPARSCSAPISPSLDPQTRVLRPHRRARVRLGRRSLFDAAPRREKSEALRLFAPITGTSRTTTICRRSRIRCWPRRA